MPGWYSQKHSEPKILKNSPELCSTGEFALIFYVAKMKLYTHFVQLCTNIMQLCIMRALYY